MSSFDSCVCAVMRRWYLVFKIKHLSERIIKHETKTTTWYKLDLLGRTRLAP